MSFSAPQNGQQNGQQNGAPDGLSGGTPNVSRNGSEALFYSDSDLTEWDAKVVRLEWNEERRLWAVELDRTAFYPEGGGQPSDRGWIGDLPVRDVRKREGRIIQYLMEKPDRPVVRCRLDWEFRYDYMQQHTGQHIISGALYRTGGYPTVSVHQGQDHTTVEIDSPDLPESHLVEAENVANEIIRRNLPVEAHLHSDAEVESLGLRREPAVSGKIRVVRIGEFDAVACGGVHLKRTGEVGLVHCIRTERIRGRVRTVWKIGNRAIQDYRKKTAVVNSLGTMFSAQITDLVKKAGKQMDSVSEIQRRLGNLEKRLARETALRLRIEANSHGSSGCPQVVTAVFRDDDTGFLRAVIDELTREPGVVGAVISVSGRTLNWVLGTSADLEFPFDRHRDSFLAALAGKGGGRSPVWQGSGTADDQGGAFFALVRDVAGECSVKKMM
jgi:alanyl-tRNA synthetase